jgi:ferrochelatase
MKRNILLVNLGSPEAPEPREVGTYLREFLGDPFVVDTSAFVRWLLVNALIVPRRKYKSAEAYKKIWTEEGSPLIVNSQNFLRKLQTDQPQWEVRLAMRYGTPALREVFNSWLEETDEPIEVVPLYPQYAKSSTGTCWDLLYKVAKDKRSLERVRVLPDFFEHISFIESCALMYTAAASEFLPDATIFSFHGLPEHHVTELDASGAHCLKSKSCCDKVTSVNRWCYRAQCYQTAKGIANQVGITDYKVTFQSRLGRRPWIKPYTDEVLKEVADSGKKRLLISCPSFVADCLETLEEIQMRAKEDFISFGEKI